MRTLGSWLLLTFIMGVQSQITAQRVTEIYPDIKIPIDKETLNVSLYSNKFQGSILNYTYKKADGTSVRVAAYNRNSEIEVFETPPPPAIHGIYKKFYANGSLKEKGVFLPQHFKIGIWIECSSNGTCKTIDHENTRSKYGYNYVLEYLESAGYYYPKTKEHEWTFSFWHSVEGKTLGVRVNKDGNQYRMYTFDAEGNYSVRETPMVPLNKPVPIVGTFIQEENSK